MVKFTSIMCLTLSAREAINCVIFFCVTSISIYIFVTNVLDIAREQALFFGKRFSMQVSFKPSVPQMSSIKVVQCKFAAQGKLIKAVKMSRLWA